MAPQRIHPLVDDANFENELDIDRRAGTFQESFVACNASFRRRPVYFIRLLLAPALIVKAG